MRTRYTLRVPRENPHNPQYVSFHVLPRVGGGWTSGWTLGMYPKWSALFDRRELAQKCIDMWATSDQPLPPDVVIEEYTDGV